MTIRKGSTWGVAAPFPDDAPIASSNAELLQLVKEGERLVGLRGGDLFRTAGGASDRLRSPDPSNFPMHLPVDVIDVQLDETRTAVFVTHLIGHSRTWRIMLAGMNVDFWRTYQLGPRAHPGDGVIDLYTANLGGASCSRSRREQNWALMCRTLALNFNGLPTFLYFSPRRFVCGLTMPLSDQHDQFDAQFDRIG